MLLHQHPIAQAEQVIKRINELAKRSTDLQSRLAIIQQRDSSIKH